MKWGGISKEETLCYKGIGILLIVLHNYFHALSPLPGENEFNFSAERIGYVLDVMVSNPEQLVRILFSYFGHFGVQVFIFLSAYGLTKSHYYSSIGYWEFISKRVLAIYPAFLLAIIFFLVYNGIPHGLLGPFKVLYWTWGELSLKVLGISNLVPSMALQPVGPWWFISFILQFYLLFPLLIRLHKAFGDGALAAIAILGTLLDIALYEAVLDFGINTKQNIIGHLPEVCLGIYFANRKSVKIEAKWIWMALLGFCLGNFFEMFWPFTFVSVLVLMIAFSIMLPSVNSISGTVFKFLGVIALPLFLINAIVRNTFAEFAKTENSWIVDIGFGVLYLMTVVVAAYLLYVVEKTLRHLVSSRIAGDSLRK